MADSEHLYSNSLVYNIKTKEQFTEEIRAMELQPLIQVHKFGFPLRLDFGHFLECFQSLDTEQIRKSVDNDRDHCLLILQSISSLNPTDYIVTDSKVFLKHDKERVMVSALWDKNGRNQRSYSRSRAQTCGELFPRGIGTSDILEKFTKSMNQKNQNVKFLQDENAELDEVSRSSHPFPIQNNFLNNDPEITIYAEDDANQRPEGLEALEGKGRALLVMMSSLGQYDRMIPITHCMRILFSSPMSDSMTMHDSYLLQLSQAIESFHISQYQNEEVAL